MKYKVSCNEKVFPHLEGKEDGEINVQVITAVSELDKTSVPEKTLVLCASLSYAEVIEVYQAGFKWLYPCNISNVDNSLIEAIINVESSADYINLLTSNLALLNTDPTEVIKLLVDSVSAGDVDKTINILGTQLDKFKTSIYMYQNRINDVVHLREKLRLITPSTVTSSNAELEVEVANLKDDLEESTKLVTSLNAVIAEKEVLVISLEKSIAEGEKFVNEIKLELENKQSKLTIAQTELELERNRATEQSKLENSDKIEESNIKVITDEKAVRLTQDLQELNVILKERETNLLELKSKVDQLEVEHTQLTKSLTEVGLLNDKLHVAVNEKEKDVENLKLSLRTSLEDKARLTKQLESSKPESSKENLSDNRVEELSIRNKQLESEIMSMQLEMSKIDTTKTRLANSIVNEKMDLRVDKVLYIRELSYCKYLKTLSEIYGNHIIKMQKEKCGVLYYDDVDFDLSERRYQRDGFTVYKKNIEDEKTTTPLKNVTNVMSLSFLRSFIDNNDFNILIVVDRTKNNFDLLKGDKVKTLFATGNLNDSELLGLSTEKCIGVDIESFKYNIKTESKLDMKNIDMGSKVVLYRRLGILESLDNLLALTKR